MSEKSQSRFKQILFIALVLVLFVLVSVQALYMHNMRKQLDILHEQQSDLLLQTQSQKNTLSNNEELIPGIKETAKVDETADANNTAALDNTAEQKPAPLPDSQPLLRQRQQQHNRNALPDRRPDVPPNSAMGQRGWNLHAEMEQMRRDMDRMFEQRQNQLHKQPDFQRHFSLSTSTPEIDVKENQHQYIVFVNLPGANADDISVTLNGQRLTVKGRQEYKRRDSDPSGNFVFQEHSSGSFRRSIRLSNPVYQNKMKTHYENGILKIIIPKISEDQWR